jgi:hypothetical protein
MSREALHNLVDRIPDEELISAQRYLEYLASHPARRAALSAPPDDEPVTAADEAAIRNAQDDIRAGRFASHDDVLREFGIK